MDGTLHQEVIPMRSRLCASNKRLSVIVSPSMGGTLWKIAGRAVDLSANAIIMGVLNVTPDSFSDGGEFFATEKAVEQGKRMAIEGAQIIDIGGESTRPGAGAVSADDQWARVVPVIGRL